MTFKCCINELVLSLLLVSDSDSKGDVLLVGELRQLLSDLSSPLIEQTSEVLDSSVLSRVTGEK